MTILNTTLTEIDPRGDLWSHALNDGRFKSSTNNIAFKKNNKQVGLINFDMERGALLVDWHGFNNPWWKISCK